MTVDEGQFANVLRALQERAKELNCLYQADEILSQQDAHQDEVFRKLVEVIPTGWQYSEVCRATIVVDGAVYGTPPLADAPGVFSADIIVEGSTTGRVTVHYVEKRPRADEGPFLKEERKLINALAERIGLYLMQRRLRRAHDSLERALQSIHAHDRTPWAILLDFLRRTDPPLLDRINRKMLNFLSWNGVDEAQSLLQETLRVEEPAGLDERDENRPAARTALPSSLDLTGRVFGIASRHLSENEIMTLIQGWIREDKSSDLIRILEDFDANLTDIVEALERYAGAGVNEADLPVAVQISLKVALIRRFFTDRLEFINLAKNHVQIGDFNNLAQHLIHSPASHGKLGGKGAGLFLAECILKRHAERLAAYGPVRVPRTWYVASDGVLEFMRHNNLDDLYNQKYMEIERIRQDYPHVIQVFKNSEMPPEIAKGLAVALDDFEDRPIIVRSSSLLEDRTGSAFSGKYKSLFLANQGNKRERLEALQDAIAEVYASIFGPDPIEYRAERGLLDFREEMGILIQEVVGTRVGRWFLPAFAGVGFSNNEFRWSPRIRRQDGLLRLVPGLGTRAVDRLSNDYPVLASPGQPGLRVNVSPAEIVRYSPKMVDAINLERNAFETVDVEALLRECGDEYPLIRHLVSIVDGDHVRAPMGLEPDWGKDRCAVTFDGLISNSPFLPQMRSILEILRHELGFPVDIEFAHDGSSLYLLQCRAQSYSPEDAAAPIPHDIPPERILFSAHRFVSNGRVPDITHIVYVDPAAYSQLQSHQELLDVARAVGRLNKLLPKRRFILLGPGRWGSRGDIKLGVGTTYSDINNCAVLLEIARQKGNYTPELSFGTHFFQDLVEAQIRYLPLYPDEEGNIFNEAYLRRARNLLPQLVPEFAALDEVVRVIDVPEQSGGRILRVLMNADLEEAVGYLVPPAANAVSEAAPVWAGDLAPEDHWRWRLRMAERIAANLDPGRFGVKAFYVFGSTKNATASPGSDLDVIVHFAGRPDQLRDLLTWLDGWSVSLAEANYLRTGYRMEGLLDVHVVTDEDVRGQTGYAAKIGAVTDAARSLPLKGLTPA